MKNFLKYSCSFLTLAVSCMLWAEEPGTIQELLKQGNQFLNAGDVKQAAAIAEQIGKQENGKIEAAFFKLQIANKMQDAEGVKKQLGSILQSDIPVNRKIDALTTYARLCRSLKKMDECRQAYQDSLNLKPDDINHVYASKMNIADTYWNADKKQHEKLLLELYHLDGITNDQKLRAMNELCSKLYSGMERNDDLLKIVADAEKIPNLTYSQKLNLLSKRTSGLVGKLELDEAKALFDQFEKDNPEAGVFPTRNQFLSSKVGFYDEISEPGNAARIYLDMLKNEQGYSNHNIRRMIEFFAADNQLEYAMAEADKILKNVVLKSVKHHHFPAYAEVITAAVKFKRFEDAEKFVADAQKLPNLKPQDKERLKVMAFDIAYSAMDLDKAAALFEVMQNEKNSQIENCALNLSNIYFDRRELAKAVKYADYVPVTIFHSGNWMEMDKIMKMFYAYGILNKNKELAEKAAVFAGYKKFNAEVRAGFALIGKLAENPKAKTNKVLDSFEIKEQQAANVLGEVARYFVKIGRNDVAEKLYNERQKLFNPAKRNELSVRYVKNAPDDVGSWLASPLLKDLSNRGNVTSEYGAKEAAFLVTDVMAAGRNVGDSSVKADKETYFYVCYDEYGIHLFFVGVDSKVKDVMAKRINGSGYEMYLALGEGGPSYQWLFDQPKDNLYSPPWNSPHEYYRNLKDYVDISSRPVENGIATAMNFSWDLAYDRLPENGDLWSFELIRWTRGGGVTWGGKSVWQIGNWGRLKFEGLDDDVLTRIRSIIIYKALARYKDQKSARSGGAIAIWQDAELGDPDFYKQCLAPEVERLDKLSQLVTDEMDKATVDKLWVEAVPAWFDFEYKAAKLREDYLRDNFILNLK